jgi:circadian clock protein KaiC
MSTLESTESEMVQTGVSGLDSILAGGLPRNRIYLIQGDPGAGKTTLALQFLLEGARRGESGLYITLSETKKELEAVAESHGWSLDQLNLFELSTIEQLLRSEAENTFFHPSEVELNHTIKVLLDEVERVKPQRVVFDSLSEMRLLSETALRFRRQILNFKQHFVGRRATVLFLDDLTGGVDNHLESIAHGVISLEKISPEYGVTRRVLSVDKIRGVKFREGPHDFVIRRGGLVIFPRLVAAEHFQRFKSEPIASGIKELDTLLGGGLDRGTATILMGPPGTGKSTVALKYAAVAAERGEQSDIFIFDEGAHTLVTRGTALGMNVQPHVKSGRIHIRKINPAELSPGELTDHIRQTVEKKNTRLVIIDSLNGYLNAMPGESYLHLQLHELLAYLNNQGVVTLMVLAQQGLMASQSPVDLTYLADSVLLFRYFEATGEVRQAISVIKKRSGNHERTIREFRVDKTGLRVGAPLRDFHGVLGGIPTFRGKRKQILK